MDQRLPHGLIGADAPDQPAKTKRRDGPVVVADGSRTPIVSLGDNGFVIEASAHWLRGFVDIVDGGVTVERRLVVCAWEQDGLVGYEYKSGGAARPVAADYAPMHPDEVYGLPVE